MESFNLGSKKVISFELLPEVIELNSMIQKFNKDLILKNLDISKIQFFEELKKLNLKFTSVIVDPPKNDVLLVVYSKEFLVKLSEFIQIKGLVSCYVPISISIKFQVILENIVQIFEGTGKFKFQNQPHPHIFVFQRV
jgi:predicted methyltransferase